MLKKDKEATEELVREVEAARDKAIIPIGNLVPDSVPISKDEVTMSVDAIQWVSKALPCSMQLQCQAIIPIGNLVPDSIPISKDEVCSSQISGHSCSPG